MTTPHRTLHLRDPQGFSDEDFARFCAGCRLFEAYVICCLRELRALGEGSGADEGNYLFEAPVRSDNGTVLSLRIHGSPSLGSRSSFENSSSHLLSRFFPVDHRSRMEEGLTEDTGCGPTTNWRAIPSFTVHWLAPKEPAKGTSSLEVKCAFRGCSRPASGSTALCDEHLRP